MSYSITPVLRPHVDKKGLQLVSLQVIYKRGPVYVKTIVKVPAKSFSNGAVVNHPLKDEFNSAIRKKYNEIETKLLDALKKSEDINIHEVLKGKGSSDEIQDFINDEADKVAKKKADQNDGVVRHIRSLAKKVGEYYPGITFNRVSLKWLQEFELKLFERLNRYGELVDQNTVHANMKRLKGIFNKAQKLGLINKDQYENYQPPKYTQKIPEFIVEQEMEGLYNLLQTIKNEKTKRAGYYFLLSCYAGYRISDLSTFDYSQRVKGDRITLRAQKNGNIVSIFIHTRLKKVLEYIKGKPLAMPEQTMREEVTSLAKLCGFERRVTPHTGRHSFAMMLAKNGFSLEETALLLGDSIDVARVYFRILDTNLDEKIKNRLG